MSRQRDARGFTVAEILVAILITGIISGVIYSSYMGGLKIIYASQKDMERTALARVILDRITGDLACVFLRVGREWLVFVGEEGSSGEYPSDRLTMTVVNHERSGRDAAEGDLAEVSYWLDNGEGALFILRREDPTLDDDAFSGGETRAVGERVAGLTFEYQGEEGWSRTWDSRENNALPVAVRVTVAIRTEEEGGGGEGEAAARISTFRTEAALPLGGSWEEDVEEDAAQSQAAQPARRSQPEVR